MNIDFIVKFIKEQIEGSSPAQFQTMVYRDGGVEIAPGEIAPAIIPEWLKDETIVIDLSLGKVKSDYGEYDISVSFEPETNINKIQITRSGMLKNGDSVIVGKYGGVLPKYVILCKANQNA